MGTPAFAAVSLQKLLDSGFEVAGVFTQPDRPRSRGMKLQPCEVKILAMERGLPVYQPASLREEGVLDALRGLAPDAIAVVAYGCLLPRAVLDLPPCGCVNLHGSLLPKYRGAAPVQWTVLNGDEYAGVSCMFMSEKLDAGDVISSRKIRVLPDETSGELFERLAPAGSELLAETLRDVLSGTAGAVPQDESEATYAPPLSRDMSPIDWTRPADEILCRIRGLHPWPCATAELGATVFRIHRAAKTDSDGSAPGTVLRADGKGLVVAAGDGAVEILELQAPGGRRMRAADYLRGHAL